MTVLLHKQLPIDILLGKSLRAGLATVGFGLRTISALTLSSNLLTIITYTMSTQILHDKKKIKPPKRDLLRKKDLPIVEKTPEYKDTP